MLRALVYMSCLVTMCFQVLSSFYLKLFVQSSQFFKKPKKLPIIHSEFQMLQKFQSMPSTAVAVWTEG